MLIVNRKHDDCNFFILSVLKGGNRLIGLYGGDVPDLFDDQIERSILLYPNAF